MPTIREMRSRSDKPPSFPYLGKNTKWCLIKTHDALDIRYRGDIKGVSPAPPVPKSVQG